MYDAFEHSPPATPRADLLQALNAAVRHRTDSWRTHRAAAALTARRTTAVDRWQRRERADLERRAAERLSAARQAKNETWAAFKAACRSYTQCVEEWERAAVAGDWHGVPAEEVSNHMTAPAYDTGYAPECSGEHRTLYRRPTCWDREYALGAVLRRTARGARLWTGPEGSVHLGWSPYGPYKEGRDLGFTSLVPAG